MKKYKSYNKAFRHCINLRKLLCAILLCSIINTLSAQAAINGPTISVNFNATEKLDEALRKIEKAAGIVMAFDPKATAEVKVKYHTFKNTDISDVLDALLLETGFLYNNTNGSILIFKAGPKVTSALQQQPRRLSGQIQDHEGEPLIGANVRIVDLNRTVATDELGQYSIRIPQGIYTLEVSYLSYATQRKTKVIVNKDLSGIDFVMEIEDNALSEVVVTYGTQKRREVTGSITEVNASEMQDMPVAQFAQQLQGKVAGVQISQVSGQPGRGMAFRIRGAASLFANNQPLFVIDGIPITGGINNINPEEIESFSVLKDASSTALYGSRAANGVILITTKHAKAGEPRVEFNSYYGVQRIPQNLLPDLMNASEYAQFQKEIYEDKVKYEKFTGLLAPEYENPEEYGEGTDWIDLMTRTAPIQSYNLGFYSANEKSSSSVIAGYFNQQGVIINNGTERFSLRLNQDFRFNDNKLKIGFSLAPSYRIDRNVRLGTDGLSGVFQDILESSPLIAPINPDGTMPFYVNSPVMVNTINQYAFMTKIKDDYKTMRFLGNAHVNYELAEGLLINTQLAIDKGGEMQNRFVPSTIVASQVATGLSSAVDNYSWTAEANLQYKRTFQDSHNIEGLIGYSAQKFDSENNSVTGTNFPNDEVQWINAATAISAGNSNTTHYSLLSQIARLNYNYNGKYLVSGAVRRDGSSRFGQNRKYGWFPSISAGWVISDEAFMRKFDKIDMLKIRMSYGITGNNNIGNYTFIANTGSSNYTFGDQLVSGITITGLGNSELAWERNKQFDIGFDVVALKNRLSFTYDYYHKLSDGLIMDRQIPDASGFSNIKFNIGEFEFWGHEFSLRSRNLTGSLAWNTSFNISFDRNVIKSLVNPGFIRQNNTTSSDYFRHQEGRPIGEFYGLIFDGLYKDADDLANSAQVQWGSWYSDIGTEKMRDVSGPDGIADGIINEYDRTFLGNPAPDFSFGLTNSFAYKGFDMSITMAGSVGGSIMNASKLYLTNMYGNRMVIKEVADRWRSPENPGSGRYPRTQTNTHNIHNQVNSGWIENGSYLTIKNISMGYNLKLKNQRSFARTVRFYGSVQQALILTGYSGMNPEANDGGADPTQGIGIDTNSYPVPRTFTLGVNLTLK